MRPGGSAHFHVRIIAGTWSAGIVQGWTYDITWGPSEGFPGITLDPGGNDVGVDVLESDRLAGFWRSLDEYHGTGYARVETTVDVGNTDAVTAWIYEARGDAE